MAITIHEQPPWPNVTKTNLVFNVSSDKSTQPQMRYVFDIHGYFSDEFFGFCKTLISYVCTIIFEESFSRTYQWTVESTVNFDFHFALRKWISIFSAKTRIEANRSCDNFEIEVRFRKTSISDNT